MSCGAEAGERVVGHLDVSPAAFDPELVVREQLPAEHAAYLGSQSPDSVSALFAEADGRSLVVAVFDNRRFIDTYDFYFGSTPFDILPCRWTGCSIIADGDAVREQFVFNAPTIANGTIWYCLGFEYSLGGPCNSPAAWILSVNCAVLVVQFGEGGGASPVVPRGGPPGVDPADFVERTFDLYESELVEELPSDCEISPRGPTD